MNSPIRSVARIALFAAFAAPAAACAGASSSNDATNDDNNVTAPAAIAARPPTTSRILTCSLSKFSNLTIVADKADAGTQIIVEDGDRPRDGQGAFVRTATNILNFHPLTVPTPVRTIAAGKIEVSGHFEGQVNAESDVDVTATKQADGTYRLAVTGNGPLLDQTRTAMQKAIDDNMTNTKIEDLSCSDPGDPGQSQLFNCSIDKFDGVRVVQMEGGDGVGPSIGLEYVEGGRPRDGEGTFDDTVETLLNLPGEVAQQSTYTNGIGFSGAAVGQAGTKLDVAVRFVAQPDGTFALTLNGSGSVFDTLAGRLSNNSAQQGILAGARSDLRCTRNP